ncbi:MAG: hypothetical protein HY289_05770 [Planctomycetes bacterium]|nr:hypothetical protein [Planctomycetota bacterium]
MLATKIETTVQNDGELHLTQLPCRKGDRVEAIILVLEDGASADEAEKKRQLAREEFLALANASKFCSTGPYPTRDELHERH